MEDVTVIPTGQLLEKYREVLLSIHPSSYAATENMELKKRADAYEEEILRRMAW